MTLRADYILRLSLVFCTLQVLFVTTTGYAQRQRMRFQHITSDEGLSNNTVVSILQDSRGFMWFGTRDGLNRYDGIKVTVFRNSVRSSASLSQNLVNDIYEDKERNLWIATSEGLDKFQAETETFKHYNPGKSVTDVRDIAEDRKGNLWIGTNKGLYQFDNKSGKFSRWKSGITATINKILADTKGFLWVGTEAGLFRIKQSDGSLKHFAANRSNSKAIQSNIIHEIFEDSQGRIWIGMSEGGLALFDSAMETFRTLKADPGFADNPDKTNSLPHNDIRSIVEGEPGILWIGTENGGLCVYNTARNIFSTYRPMDTDPGSLSHDSLHSLFKDKQGNIWIGTWAGGVNFFSKSLLKFQLFNKFPNAEFPGVESIERDRYGMIWLGVVENGLYKFNPQNQKFIYYPNPNISKFEVGVYSIADFGSDTLALAIRRGGMALFSKRDGTFIHYLPRAGKNSISGHELNSVMVDRQKNIWSGGWNTGLSCFNIKTRQFKNYKHNPRVHGSLSNDLIYTIYEDRAGRVWIGTDGGGLNLFNPRTNGFEHFLQDKTKASSLSHNTVISLYEDGKGRFWVGTSNGLNLMDRQKKTFKVFTQKNGLPNDVIKSIIEDDYGTLWLGTNKGLCSFNPETQKTKNFGVKDGLQGNEFLMNACAKDLAGNLYFSGYKGMNVFHPQKLRYNTFVPPVIITDFLIANKPVAINEENSPLKQHISKTKELTLSYDHSAFSFDYAALNYVSPDKNQYAFKMEGFEDSWNYVGSKHTATYTNLDPGTYTFRVIASNNDGIWNMKGASLKIRILPPFWETWWFRLLSFGLILGSAYAFLSYRREQELKVLEEKRREEMQQVQLQFFTNISHEFRTPLSLILGPLEKLVSGRPDEGTFKNYYKVMHKNANRLMNLINELMDFRKIESGALKLKVTPGNLASFVSEIAEDFSNTAEERNIDYVLDLEAHDQNAFDRQVVEKIVLNLINNSFKYTPDGGRIEVKLSKEINEFPAYENTLILKSDYTANNYVYLCFRDTGIGISKDSIEHLFQRYYRIADAHLGSGVGLAFVKSLTFLHKGQIYVSSQRNKGTEIIIALPASKGDYRSQDTLSDLSNEPEVRLESLHYPAEPDKFNSESLQPAEKRELTQKHILIVDDNEELRSFIKDSLGEDYKISEAANGREGLAQAKEISPDLIISDVMMPDMNGIEFCRLVKDDVDSSHIPFMMLTAKNTLESEIEGVGSGADYYFTKPVSVQLLLLTIKNIFAQRQKLKDHFSQDHRAEIRDLVHSTKDKEFIDKLLGIIESQLINPDLDIEYLCREIGMSRTKLYQKIKSITGQPIGEFIRTIRLRKAVDIMTHEDVPIAEVIYRVGIQTQSYFSKAFKKEFGKTPSQFLSETKKHTK